MTDQTIPAVTDDDRRLAREWASNVRRHADKHFPAERAIARVILDAVPSPPTLADMTNEERAACRWMQADVAGHDTRYVIADPDDGDGEAALVSADGRLAWIFPERVTPRPDLPRLEWPGTGQDGEEVAKVDYVSVAGGRTAYGPWTVARLRKKPDTSDAVPESTLAVGSVWDDGDSLTRACEETGRDQITVTDRDGDVSVWGANLHAWRGPYPVQKYAPFTILHAGKKADQ